MIFALYDLYHYRRRSGRYERNVGQGDLMGLAFEGRLPDVVVAGLKPGDMLYLLSFGSIISWLILYSTKGHVNHSAMYVGNGNIMHSTFDGVVLEPIEVLFGPYERILPCVPNWPDEARAKVAASAAEMQGIPYGWRMVSRKALRLLSGRAWPIFRWTLFLDICVLLLLLDAPFLLLFGFPLFTFIIPLYLILVLFNWARSKYRPLTVGEMADYPYQNLEAYYFHGGAALIPDFEALKQDPYVTAFRPKQETEN